MGCCSSFSAWSTLCSAWFPSRRRWPTTTLMFTDAGKLRTIFAKVAADGYAVLEQGYVLGGSATAAAMVRSLLH